MTSAATCPNDWISRTIWHFKHAWLRHWHHITGSSCRASLGCYIFMTHRTLSWRSLDSRFHNDGGSRQQNKQVETWKMKWNSHFKKKQTSYLSQTHWLRLKLEIMRSPAANSELFGCCQSKSIKSEVRYLTSRRKSVYLRPVPRLHWRVIC